MVAATKVAAMTFEQSKLGRFLDLSLIVGVLPAATTVAGFLGLVLLLGRTDRRWWGRWVPAALVGAALALTVLVTVVDRLWRPFPDPLSARVWVWVCVALVGVATAVANWGFSRRRIRRVVAVVALVLVVAVAAMKVNAVYGYYPTLRAALGRPPANEIAFTVLPRSVPSIGARPGGELDQVWRAPPDMPQHGRIAEVDIPGVESGFLPRRASIYLPPAYLSFRHRALLPVLVLMAGQPGSPQDWLTAGRLAEVMDNFAAAHRGLAPLVVLPDATGSTLANPLCMDSDLGHLETYLARDVPDWVKAHLQVDPDPQHWAAAGFSYGGTCALQLAVRQPRIYPTFIDISGQDEPTLGDHTATVAATFHGDETAFRAVDPLTILATTGPVASAGIIAAGADDPEDLRQQRNVLAATSRAGIATRWVQVPGGHTWPVAISVLTTALSLTAPRLGLSVPNGP